MEVCSEEDMDINITEKQKQAIMENIFNAKQKLLYLTGKMAIC